jgi:hypothetical protein
VYRADFTKRGFGCARGRSLFLADIAKIIAPIVGLLAGFKLTGASDHHASATEGLRGLPLRLCLVCGGNL